MLSWFKRNAAPVPREQSVETDNRTPPSEIKIERLVDRLGSYASSGNTHVAGLPQMRVIVVASQKGGVGKTTVAAHLAVHASKVGHGPAVLVDTDPQGSLSEWWDARKDEHERNEDTLTLATADLR